MTENSISRTVSTTIDYAQHVDMKPGGGNNHNVQVNNHAVISRQDADVVITTGTVVNAQNTPTKWERFTSALSQLKNSVSELAVSAGRGIKNAPGAIWDGMKAAPGKISTGMSDLSYKIAESLRDRRDPLPRNLSADRANTALIDALSTDTPDVRLVTHLVAEAARHSDLSGDTVNLKLFTPIGTDQKPMTQEKYDRLTTICRDIVDNPRTTEGARKLAQHFVNCGSIQGLAAYEISAQYDDLYADPAGDPSCFLRENTLAPKLLVQLSGGDAAKDAYAEKLNAVMTQTFSPALQAFRAPLDQHLANEPAKDDPAHGSWEAQLNAIKKDLGNELRPAYTTGAAVNLFAQMAKTSIETACDLDSPNGYLANFDNDELRGMLDKSINTILASDGDAQTKKAALEKLFISTVFLRGVGPSLTKMDFSRATDETRYLRLATSTMMQRVVNRADNDKVSPALNQALAGVLPQVQPQIDALFSAMGMPSMEQIAESCDNDDANLFGLFDHSVQPDDVQLQSSENDNTARAATQPDDRIRVEVDNGTLDTRLNWLNAQLPPNVDANAESEIV